MKFAENDTMGGFASHRSRDSRRVVFEIGPQRCLEVCHCLVFLTIFKAWQMIFRYSWIETSGTVWVFEKYTTEDSWVIRHVKANGWFLDRSAISHCWVFYLQDLANKFEIQFLLWEISWADWVFEALIYGNKVVVFIVVSALTISENMKLERKSELQISGVVGWDEWSCRPWRASCLLVPEPDRCHWRRHALLTQLLADPHQHRVMIVCQFGKQRQSRRRSGEQSIRDVWLDEMTNTWDENLNRLWVWSSQCYNNAP